MSDCECACMGCTNKATTSVKISHVDLGKVFVPVCQECYEATQGW
jgi:hypothetical protein